MHSTAATRHKTFYFTKELNILFSSLIKGRPSDGFALGTEDFIRQAIREFSFQETTILRQLVTSIAPVNKVNRYNNSHSWKSLAD